MVMVSYYDHDPMKSVKFHIGEAHYIGSSSLSLLHTSNLWEMSAGGAFGGNRGLRPVPPEKGVFPLDHQHECDLEKKEYLACLKSSAHHSENCREFSKKYLQCRMEKNLMARQDLSELGFGRDSDVQNSKEMIARDLSHDKETVAAVQR